jgi:hypothetical protein
LGQGSPEAKWGKMNQVKQFFMENYNSFNRSPVDYCINLAIQIIAIGFGLWVVLTAAHCSVNMVSSAI